MNALSIGSILSIANMNEKSYENYCQYNKLKLKEHKINTLKSLVEVLDLRQYLGHK